MRHLIALCSLLLAAPVLAQGVGYEDTPLIPGQPWKVHDKNRPNPPIVDPGPAPDTIARPPSDATVLFDGSTLDAWQHADGSSARWQLIDGHAMQVKPGSGDIQTREHFGDVQLHLEFATPEKVEGESQGRGNSGVFFFGMYEIQILDSYDNKTYADGQAASIYGQHPPLVNASRKPGQWQTYDIVFEAPRFDDEGELERPAYVTVFHNGVLVHSHTELLGATQHRNAPKYQAHGNAGPIKLQDHGNTMRFRNIWVRPLKLDIKVDDDDDGDGEDDD